MHHVDHMVRSFAAPPHRRHRHEPSVTTGLHFAIWALSSLMYIRSRPLCSCLACLPACLRRLPVCLLVICLPWASICRHGQLPFFSLSTVAKSTAHWLVPESPRLRTIPSEQRATPNAKGIVRSEQERKTRKFTLVQHPCSKASSASSDQRGHVQMRAVSMCIVDTDRLTD